MYGTSIELRGWRKSEKKSGWDIGRRVIGPDPSADGHRVPQPGADLRRQLCAATDRVESPEFLLGGHLPEQVGFRVEEGAVHE